VPSRAAEKLRAKNAINNIRKAAGKYRVTTAELNELKDKGRK
jgi:hypothetical protein